MRRARIEIVTVGQNDNLQLVGSDPLGGAYDLGLQIGTNGGPQTPTQRQLFMLAAKTFNAGQRGRLVGFREYLTIGLQSASATPGVTYPLERPVETPTWKYADGNVLWGIRMMGPGEEDSIANAQNSNGLAFGFSQTPAQLFNTIVGNVITPPNGGAFPGNVLTPELGRMFDLRCRRWSYPSECDIPFEGPCTIAFFASVQQTNPGTRTNPIVPACSNPIPVSEQISGAAPLPANTLVAHWIVVTTSGGAGVIGDLYFDNGSGVGNVAIIAPFVGESIIPSTNFTGGTISLNAGQIYTWSGSSFVVITQSQLLTTQGAVPEDAFLQSYPGSTYQRIAGSLIFEMEEQAPTGAPKTYRRPGDADRITRDTTETGDNTMRRSAEDTSQYDACGPGTPPSSAPPLPGHQPKRPASPPHPNSPSTGRLAGLPKIVTASSVAIARIVKTWRTTKPPKGSR